MGFELEASIRCEEEVMKKQEKAMYDMFALSSEQAANRQDGETIIEHIARLKGETPEKVADIIEYCNPY